MLYLLSINLQAPNFDFFPESAFESGLLFLRNIALFPNLQFSSFSAGPLYQNARIERGIILGCLWKIKIIAKY